jgi:hypothetical protein
LSSWNEKGIVGYRGEGSRYKKVVFHMPEGSGDIIIKEVKGLLGMCYA